MTILTGQAWKKLPGNFDTLHTSQLYKADNYFGIPNLKPQPKDLWPPNNLFPLRYTQKIRTERPCLLHFHTDDYRFENIWHEPARGTRAASRPQIWAACTPDFSLWLEYPLALQIYNTYRNRWTGCLWQSKGITVIPSVNWSHPNSYEFAFAGIPKSQVVTLRAYANLSTVERKLFESGYAAMVDAIAPRAILWAGQPSTVIADNIPKLILPLGGAPYFHADKSPTWAGAT